MSSNKTSGPGLTLKAAGLTALLSLLVPNLATAEPFTGLSGAWNGAGRITMSDGASEPIRCRATYAANQAGTTLEQILRCASDSYKFNVKSNVEAEGDALIGQWTETTYNMTGEFVGKTIGPKIEGRVRGSGLSVGVALLTRGNEQQVRILSQGTKVREVTIKLRKGS
jgi:hypothetical protein